MNLLMVLYPMLIYINMKLLAVRCKYFSITTRLTNHEYFVEVGAKNDMDGLGC